MSLRLGCPVDKTLHAFFPVDVAEEGGVRGRCKACGGETVPVLECDDCGRKVRQSVGWKVDIGTWPPRLSCSECRSRK